MELWYALEIENINEYGLLGIELWNLVRRYFQFIIYIDQFWIWRNVNFKYVNEVMWYVDLIDVYEKMGLYGALLGLYA